MDAALEELKPHASAGSRQFERLSGFSYFECVDAVAGEPADATPISVWSRDGLPSSVAARKQTSADGHLRDVRLTRLKVREGLEAAEPPARR